MDSPYFLQVLLKNIKFLQKTEQNIITTCLLIILQQIKIHQ